jgi:porphobilinogen deaminase
MKLAYALLITYHKLSHYFKVHEIEVHTSSTLGDIFNNREDRKVGHKAVYVRHCLQVLDGHKGSDVKRLHG